MNKDSWEVMNIIAEKKKRNREIKKLFNMIKDAKIDCYDNLETYYGLDYMNYIPKENFIEYMRLYLEYYGFCPICGEENCDCLEERRTQNQ